MAASLGDTAWTELDAPHTLLVPIGSTEQHGPHLPLDTDTRIAEAVARRAAAGSTTLVAPALAYGACGEHETFAGTVSIGHDALHGVLVELGRSACRWAARLVWVNGHGGNRPAVRDATALLRSESREVAWFACNPPGADAHAGHAETSMLLALDPDAVRRDAVRAGNTAALGALMPTIRRSSVRAVSDSGVLGDPTTASAADGHRLLASMADRLAAALRRWQPGPDGALDTPAVTSAR